MHKKYCLKKHPTDCVAGIGGSSTWHRLLQARAQTEPGIKWIISESKINFWHDYWFQKVKLREGINVPPDLQKLSVKKALSHIPQRESFCLTHFDHLIVREIHNMLKLITNMADIVV